MLRTRFAPSPTGSLHVGGARTALYCLAAARNENGVFLLRIEDTDQTRSTAASTQGILSDLAWLGLDWDEGPLVGGKTGPYFQSKRLDTYGKYVQQLLSSGAAYHAYETHAELGAMREEAIKATGGFTYQRVTYTDDEVAKFNAEGRVPVVRFASQSEPVTIQDQILGDVIIPGERLDDFVIQKADGFPTYHFAVVIDDHLMEVTAVLRGQEHLINTSKHLQLYKAFNWDAPIHAHLPLIFNPQGAKMSKREKAKSARSAAREAAKVANMSGQDWLAKAIDIPANDAKRFMKKKSDDIGVATAIAEHLSLDLPMIEVMDFRKGGYLPEALNNYLALLGWNAGNDTEFYTIEELSQSFSLARVNKTPARFDPVKLRWMNREYLRRASLDRLRDALDSYLEVTPSTLSDIPTELRDQILSLFRERAHTLAELDESCQFIFSPPTAYAAKAVKKHMTKNGGTSRLPAICEALSAVTVWTTEAIGAALSELAETKSYSMGEIAQPIRVAISGDAVTPPIYETLSLIPQVDTLERLNRAITVLTTSPTV
jgi:glutamyl-tRNA synthetase